MKKSTGLLLAGILGLVLMAPPAYPQNQKDQLNSLMADSLNLQNTVKHLQASLDQKHAETTKLLQQVLDRFVAIDASVKTLNDSLSSVSSTMKANDEKAAKNLEAARTAVESLKRDLDESILGLQGQVRSLNTQITSLKTTEEPLPTATQLFQQAYTDFNAGLYSVAVDEFKEFLRNFPNDPTRSPMALIYTGEALMFQKKYEPAIVEFDSVLSKFPSSDRKCLALYRKGQAHVALNKLSEATTVFNTVVKDCPGTQEATNAANDLKAMPKPGARGGKE